MTTGNGNGARARGSRLWAITAYYNPAGFTRRRTNYNHFRRRLPVPLLTVELARSPDAFHLGEGDADKLIQLTGQDAIWQKERLLNLALRALPAECDQVAWLDCDVVFETPDWAARVSATLEEFPVAQAFARFFELGPEAGADGLHPGLSLGGGASSAQRLAEGMPVEELFARRLGNRIQRGHTVGLAWAARRALLDRHGLYDACILGGGDKAMMCAALGRYEYVVSLDFNERQMSHYLAWAEPFHAAVAGRIGAVDATLYHLWHGELRFRQHRHRHRILREYSFDPYADVALDESDVWQWSSDKPEMHHFFRNYFVSRREDG